MKTSTLRPGLLVSLKTSVTGNIKYNTTEIEADHITADGSKKARWEGERIVAIPDEHERSVKARSRARSCITGVCAVSAFGLLCPEDQANNLTRAIADAQRIVDGFNETAKLTRIGLFVIAGRIANDDAEAARAISNEVRELIEEMGSAIGDMDVEAIRKAANKAKSVGKMLSPEAQARVQSAIDAARATATKIVAAGEKAALTIDTDALQVLAEARTSFLDLGEAITVAVPEETGRGIDFEPDIDTNIVTGELSRDIGFGV